MSNRFIGYITLALTAAFLLIVGANIYTRHFQNKVTRIAYSDDAGNLKVDNVVKFHGVNVGTVTHITRDASRNKAVITLRLQKDLIIRSDYLIINKDLSLTGDRGLFIFPGDTGSIVPFDSSLSIYFQSGIAEGIRNADTLKDIVGGIREIIKDYSRIDSTNDSLFITKLNSAVQELNQMSLKLENLVSAKGPTLIKTIHSVEEASGVLRDQAHELRPVVSSALVSAGAVSITANDLMNRLIPAIDNLYLLLDQIDKGDNFAGKLLNDKESYQKLTDAARKTIELLKVFEKDGIKLGVSIF